MDQIIVGIGDCRIAAGEQVLTTYALGSCIGLAVYDTQMSIGGLLHFVLPDSTIDPARAKVNPFVFADTGVPALLQALYHQGAVKRRLRVHAAGAAEMNDHEGVFEIGKRNYLALRRILWKSGLLLHGEAVGGSHSRTVRLDTSTGRLWLQEAGTTREFGGPCVPQGGK